MQSLKVTSEMAETLRCYLSWVLISIQIPLELHKHSYSQTVIWIGKLIRIKLYFLLELVLILISLTHPVADAGSQTRMPARRRSQQWDVSKSTGVAFLQWWCWLMVVWSAAESWYPKSARSSASGWYKHKQVVIQLDHWTAGHTATQPEDFYLKYLISLTGIHYLSLWRLKTFIV